MSRLLEYLQRFIPAPQEWFGDVAVMPEQQAVEALECTSYKDLVDHWSDTRNKPGGKPGALFWSDQIDIGFSAMLATSASTLQQGAQIFLRVISPPGGVKTTLCEAMLANPGYTYPMSISTGFHSGQEGNHLFHLMNGKTVIWNEADTLLSSPHKDQILSHMRDHWSGNIRASYRNGVRYEIKGLRTTYILAGTATVRKLNRSSAGDRFLDVIIYERKVKGGADENEIELLDRVAQMAITRTRAISGETLDSQDDQYKVLAIRKTVGYINWLRSNAPKLLETVDIPLKAVAECRSMAQLVAYMRARPDEKADDDETEVELGTRLTEQLVRMAMCLAVVLGKPAVDVEVMRRVATIANHTCRGKTLQVCQILKDKRCDRNRLVALTGWTPDTVSKQLGILEAIGCIRQDKKVTAAGVVGSRQGVYTLSPQVSGLISKMQSMMFPRGK